MTKSKVIASALLVALATTVPSSSANMVSDEMRVLAAQISGSMHYETQPPKVENKPQPAEEDEMAKIAFSVASILNKHETKPVEKKKEHKGLTQEQFDKMVDEVSKKVPVPKAPHKVTETKSLPSDLDHVMQADIDRIVAQINEKNAKKGTPERKNMVVIPKSDTNQEAKQREFDRLFNKLQNELKINSLNKPQAVPTVEHKAMTTEDKYDEIVAKIMKQKQPAVHTVQSSKSIEEQENEVVAQLMKKTGVTRNDILASLKEEAKPAQAPTGDKYEQIVAQLMKKKGIDMNSRTISQSHVENKTEEKTTVSCLFAHAGATSTIRRVAYAADHTFGIESVRNVKQLLEELASNVDKINSACEDKYKVMFTHANMLTISSTCSKDFAMAGTLSKIFRDTHPGSIQRVMATAKEMMYVREHMKKNC